VKKKVDDLESRTHYHPRQPEIAIFKREHRVDFPVKVVQMWCNFYRIY
jgi:hypothetical protein